MICVVPLVLLIRLSIALIPDPRTISLYFLTCIAIVGGFLNFGRLLMDESGPSEDNLIHENSRNFFEVGMNT